MACDGLRLVKGMSTAIVGGHGDNLDSPVMHNTHIDVMYVHVGYEHIAGNRGTCLQANASNGTLKWQRTCVEDAKIWRQPTGVERPRLRHAREAKGSEKPRAGVAGSGWGKKPSAGHHIHQAARAANRVASPASMVG